MLLKLAVLIVTFPGLSPFGDPVGSLQSGMQEVATYYQQQSYGRFTFSPDVFGVYTIERPISPTSAFDARNQVAVNANAAATAAGVNVAAYQSIVYILPHTTYIGAGYGDRQGVWIALHQDFPATPSFQLLAHELGHHFFSLNHARGCAYSDQTPLGTNGGTCLGNYNQGDTLDVMGRGYLSFNPIIKRQLGWLDANQLLIVTKDGEYTLTPYGTIGGLKVLILQGGTKRNPANYWIHYRQPIGADARLNPWTNPENLFHGAVFHAVVVSEPQLLKMTPSESPNTDTPALQVNDTFCDPFGQKIAVTPIRATESELTVRINVGRCR
jgi:hypothetical protein